MRGFIRKIKPEAFTKTTYECVAPVTAIVPILNCAETYVFDNQGSE
jgi:hypothetical protein